MITKAEITSIDRSSNRCVVRIPLFENASAQENVEIEALVSIVPGLYNNLFTKDIVFVAFEENALEKPVIIGKLYTGAATEQYTPGGTGLFNSIKVSTAASLPASTVFTYPNQIKKSYEDLKTPKKIADYIKWLETFSKQAITTLDENFRCFKTWTQWQLQAENVEIDDGDADEATFVEAIPCQYQAEGAECAICKKECFRNTKNVRQYQSLDTSKAYPTL